MKECLKEWLLRKLIADLIKRQYGVHLMRVIIEEYLDQYYEDNLHNIHGFIGKNLYDAVMYIEAKGDPLL